MKSLFVNLLVSFALLISIATDLFAGEMSDNDRITHLEAILRDSSRDNPTGLKSPRKNAIYYLGKEGGRRSFDLIRNALLNDPYPEVRAMAAQVLQGSIFELEAKSLLDSALQDTSHGVRLYAAASLCRLGSNSPQVFEILKRAAIGVGKESWDMRGFVDPDEGEDARERTRSGWRQHAILSLGHSGSDIAAKTLTEVLESISDEEWKYQVRKAIKKNNERNR